MDTIFEFEKQKSRSINPQTFTVYQKEKKNSQIIYTCAITQSILETTPNISSLGKHFPRKNKIKKKSFLENTKQTKFSK